ncbi:MAG: ABC transporter ATP-binding protein [Aureispira sp.]|nr:ABC transporter ATP-binding protein [Aureispira sp.]
MKHFFSTLRYIKHYKAHAVFNILFNILTTFFTIVSFLVLKPFLDILFTEGASYTPAASGGGFIEQIVGIFNSYLVEYINMYGKKAGLLFVCVVVGITFFMKNLFRYLALWIMAPVRYGIERYLRQEVFEKLLMLPLSYFSDERKGDLMSRITSDVNEIQWSVLQSLETIVRSPVAIIGSLLVMVYISPTLTGFSFLLILFVGLIIGGIGKTLRKKSAKAQESLGNLLSILDETLGGLRIVQGFAAEDYKREKFGKENHYYYGMMKRIMRRKDLSSPLTEFLGISIVLVLLLFGGNLVFEGHFEASTFVVFVMMFYNIIDPAKSFSSAFYAIQKGSAAAERVNKILETPISIQDQPNAESIQTLEKGIEFQNINFEYEEGNSTLNSINLSIRKGQSIALVGPSGAGKSTLVDLLPRFYDVEQGQVLVDGKNIKSYKLEDLRNLMGIVSQEAILFNDTIYNNIVFGLKNITPQQVEEAAKVANAHDFIIASEKGYQTRIGDRGTKLSGGQRQRITLARAILRNPPILILDEATSALDSESEKLVQEALIKVMQNRTSIVIAHRLSTIQHVDQIIVMQEGKIIEQGNHKELLAKGGVYKKLVRLQSM